MKKQHTINAIYSRSWKNVLTILAVCISCSVFAADKAQAPAPEKNASPNIFTNGNFKNKRDWHPSFYISQSPGLNHAEAIKQLRALSKKNFVTGENGNTYARIETPDNFAEVFKNSKNKSALSGYLTIFKLKETLKAPQEFKISFRYRGKATNPKIHNAFFVALQFRKGNKFIGSWSNYGLRMTEAWKDVEFRFKAPAETEMINFTGGLAGTGFCEFGDIVVTKVQ